MKRLTLIAGLLLTLCVPASAQFKGANDLGMPGFNSPAPTGGSAMKTPILAMAFGFGISTTAANYNGLFVGDGSNSWSASNSLREQRVAAPGTISNLVVNFPTALAAATSYTIALTKNGANTALLCSITSAALNCTDTTDTVTFAAGDTAGWSSCPGPITAGTCIPGTAPNAQTSVQVGALFTSTNNNESFFAAGTTSNNLTLGTTNTMGIYGAVAVSATETGVTSVVPTAGTIDHLYVDVQSSPGAAASVSYTVNQNGTPTGLTCTIGPSASAKACTDLTDSITVAAGDTISLSAVTVTGSPTSPGNTRTGVRWVPTIAGEAVALSTGIPAARPATNATTYGGSIGAASYTATSGNEILRVAIIPFASTIKKLQVFIAPVPGGSTTRTVTVRHGTGGGQSSSTVTCTITSAATACNDASHTYSASLNDFINYISTVSGTNAALTAYSASFVITVP